MKMTNHSAWTQALTLAKQLGRHLPLALALGWLSTPALAQSTYSWNVLGGNWSTPANWTPTTTGPSGPAATDTAIFGVNATTSSPTTPTSVVDGGFAGTISNLTYNSSSATAYQVTQIGGTLKVNGSLLVGGLNGVSANVTTLAYMTGGGALVINKGSLVVQNYNNSASAGSIGILNLAGLSTFVYNNPTGTVSIADVAGSNTRLGGAMVLAGVSNIITATNMNFGTSTAAQAGPACFLGLGTGTNIFNVGTINVANQKCTFSVTNAGGGLRIRGVSGANTDRANLIVGNRNVPGGSGNTTGSMLLNGMYVDIKAGTLTVGENPTTAPNTSGDAGIGVFQFDTGIVDATNVVMAYNTAPNSGVSRAYSTVTVGANGLLLVGTGGISLLNQTASNVCSSTLNISNGAVICNGNITIATNAADGTGAAAQTNIINIIGGGSLALGSGCIAGTANSPIGQLSLDTTSSLRFVAPPSGQPAMVINNLVWPATDTGVTLVVSNLPPTATVGSVIPLVHFNVMTGGTFTAPVAVLPPGVTGTLSLSGNSIVVTVNSSIYPYFTGLAMAPATLATNTAFIFTGGSTVTTITNVQVVAQTTTLGGITNTLTTNLLGSAGLTVSGLGTATATISLALAPNTIYNWITATITDANGRSVSQTMGQFDTLTSLLVIEASDFNFSSGQFIDTPANGGVALYTNQIGVQGVDENKAVRAGVKSYYRTNDAVVIQAANPQLGPSSSLTEQKFLIAAANGDTVDTEQEVGYNTPGDWLNYTRTFGSGGSAPAGTYNVWCYLATSGTGPQATLYQVTGDRTQPSQTTNLLGTFGTSAFSDNGYNNYVYVPLVDQYGNRVALTVGGGVQTFRSTIVGNPNVAFYMLTPVAPVLTPQVLHVYPDGTASGQQSTNKLTFVIGPAQGAAVTMNGIQLIVNGVDVTSELTFSLSGGNWTATLPIQSNLLYTATINVTNNAGFSTSLPFSFDTLSLNNFQWEAVDYDFSTNDGTAWHSGLFIDNPVPTGDTNAPYVASGSQTPNVPVNSYYWFPEGFSLFNDPVGVGAVAVENVDMYYTNAAGLQSVYRNDGTAVIGGTQAPPVVGASIASDTLNGGLRYQFLLSQTNTGDPYICEFNLGWFNTGFWVNYTRTYPTGKFNVWGRLAGGSGAFSGTTLSLVTSGVGTSNQTTQVLGSFADSAPSGWQAYHWIPMLDTNGNRVVVSLGGKATLRLTSGNNLNPLFFMLTPAVSPSIFDISSTQVGGNVEISIPTAFGFNYTLWQSSSLAGAGWTQVGALITGDGLVHTVSQPATASQTFYRVLAQ
jgi:hypothetical protein